MKILNDINGKCSSKRYAGWVLLLNAVAMGYLSNCLNISETLIIAFLSAGVGLLSVTVFEKIKTKINGR